MTPGSRNPAPPNDFHNSLWLPNVATAIAVLDLIFDVTFWHQLGGPATEYHPSNDFTSFNVVRAVVYAVAIVLAMVLWYQARQGNRGARIGVGVLMVAFVSVGSVSLVLTGWMFFILTLLGGSLVGPNGWMLWLLLGSMAADLALLVLSGTVMARLARNRRRPLTTGWRTPQSC